MGKKILTGLIGLTGLGFTGLAFLANLFGLDRNNNWGPGRTIVAITGISLIVVVLLIISWSFVMKVLDRVKEFLLSSLAAFLKVPAINRLLQTIYSRLSLWKAAWNRFPVVRWYVTHVNPVLLSVFRKIRNSRLVRFFTDSQNHMAALAAVVLGCVIVVIYVWFVSVGRWTNWPKTTTYYYQLATAFWHGQTSLLVKPDPSLLKLADPYKLENRNNISYPWDVVLYNGKFYLYWGPTPALVLSAIRLFYANEIGDQVLVFIFVCGTFLFESMMILRLRRRLFPNLRWPYVIPGIIMAGLANPLPWLLNRPAVYEAAIAGGQFFLIAGLYLGFIAIEQERPRPWLLALASICWVLSIGSRASLALVALFLSLAVAWKIFRHRDLGRGRMFAIAALLFPFLAGLVGIGWYNKDRFGSWFEFGFQYQLTGMDTHVQTFSPANLLINLHNYFINPYRTLSIFPYVKPDWGGHFIFFPIHAPANFYSEQVGGVIPIIPYVLLAVIPILFLLRHAWQTLSLAIKNPRTVQSHTGNRLLEWTAFILIGASLLAFAPILFFIAATMRYLGDVVPLLVLSSTFGFWLGASYLDKPVSRGWFVALVALLMVFSAVISLLLAVTGYDSRFEKLNPALFEHLTRILSP